MIRFVIGMIMIMLAASVIDTAPIEYMITLAAVGAALVLMGFNKMSEGWADEE
jgi:hypothetical protein